MDRAESFRQAAAQQNRGRSKNSWRYPRALKDLAIEYCRAQRRRGTSWSKISESLGVSTVTLSRWCAAPSAGRFRAVEVREPAATTSDASASLAVVTPGGLRVEGLSWSQVLELVKESR